MKKIWKKTIGFICAAGLSVIWLTGCSGNVTDNSVNQGNKDVTDNSVNQENKDVTGNSVNRENDGAFYDGADLEGDVVEFSETGFSLSPSSTWTEDDGGEVLAGAAPGAQKEEDNIQITYTDNTVFQIVNLSMSSQSEVSREDADKESVKKQSHVCIFGSCQDSHHWTADKILILRWQ